jgi:hypothetical protein
MKITELRDVILEAYAEVLSEQGVPTTMDDLLSRFPSLHRTVQSLLTKDYKNFISGIEWVSPKPSTFRVMLNNKQALYLKWLGKGFQAQIEGKSYYLDNITDFQQALARLSELLKHNEPTPEDDLAGDATSEFDQAPPPPPEAAPAATDDFSAEPTPPGETSPDFEEPV